MSSAIRLARRKPGNGGQKLIHTAPSTFIIISVASRVCAYPCTMITSRVPFRCRPRPLDQKPCSPLTVLARGSTCAPRTTRSPKQKRLWLLLWTSRRRIYPRDSGGGHGARWIIVLIIILLRSYGDSYFTRLPLPFTRKVVIKKKKKW